MSHPLQSPSPAEAVAALARRSVVVTVVTSLLAAACLLGGVALGVRAATEDVAEQVTATVEDEGTHDERRGGRRSRHWVDVRHVEVVTDDGDTGRINSDDLQVGDTTTVWRDLDDGQISAEEPGGLGFGRILLYGGLVLLGLLVAAVAVGSARRTARLRRADVESAPRAVLVLDRAKAADPALTSGPVWQLPMQVLESEHPRLKVGAAETLVFRPGSDPVDVSHGAPECFEARVLHSGLMMKVVALRTSPQDPWWVTDL